MTNENDAALSTADAIKSVLQTGVKIDPQPSRDKDSTLKEKHSEKYAIIQQIKDYLEKRYLLRYNQISNKVEFVNRTNPETRDYQEFNDEKFYTTLLDLQKQTEGRVTRELLRTILSSDFVHSYNPFEDYFESIKPLNNGEDYISILADRIVTKDQPLFRKYFRMWFISIVACTLDKRTENQTVLLLKGAQGIGKTRFLRHLVPSALWDYMYEGGINPNNKEHERHLAEKFIIIMDEFDSQSERRSEALKSLITRQAISIRRPYSINYFNAPRVASFCGTTNKDYFLKDQSGSRRFLIGEVLTIDARVYEYLDYAYAQAYHLWKEGERYYLNAEDIEEVNEINKEYTEVNVEEEFLLNTFRPVGEQETRDYSLTASSIAQVISRKHKIPFNPRIAQKMGALLKKNGFISGKTNGSLKYAVKMIE